MHVTEGPGGTIEVHGSEGWRRPMRLVITTRHRKMVIVTGDDVETEEADTGTYVSNTGADTQVAPTEPEWIEEEDRARFGFRA